MRYFLDQIKNKFFSIEWYEVYEFIEFIINRFHPDEKFILSLNKIFEEEKAPYRIVGDFIAPLTSEIEIKEIKRVFEAPDKYQPARAHIIKALESFSKRPQPDFKNSIKESIHSVEALARIVLTNPNATLGDLANKLPIHPVFREGLKKLYGWTSDEGGIRHSEKQFPPLSANEEEARFMLVLASAFVNYIISKYEKTKQ